MSIANEITKAQNNLKDCYDVCKSVDGVVLPDNKNFDNLPALIEQALNPFQKPTDWSDIRLDCPANSIALYAGHSADYSQYDNLGFTATCIGGYKVFIDGTQYGSTYASASNCTITWSSLALTTGDDITTPTSLKAHKIWISPATAGNNITAFKCQRVAASGIEQQGVLWAHFNINNFISISRAFGLGSFYGNSILTATTAKNNILNITTCDAAFAYTASLQYIPLLCGDGNSTDFSNMFNASGYPAVSLKNFITSQMVQVFRDSGIKKISLKNVDTSSVKVFRACFYGNEQIEELPVFDFSSAENMQTFLLENISLKNTILDVRSAKNLQIIGCYGTSQYFMQGFKGLRVSNEAPFNYATSPQINVNYTGMDRNALVQLFNDLPYNVGYTVVGSPTITDGVASGFSNSNRLQLNNSEVSSINSFEVAIKFTTPSESWSASQTLIGYQSQPTGLTNLHCLFNLSPSNGYPSCYLFKKQDNSNPFYFLDIDLRTRLNETFTFIVKTDMANVWLDLYDANGSLVKTSTYTSQDLVGQIKPGMLIGVRTYDSGMPFLGSIDLNNTYIKVNDVYWFRGQPAMTKTLSCVGATGTSDLTAEDKDIALNKGWSLTLS